MSRIKLWAGIVSLALLLGPTARAFGDSIVKPDPPDTWRILGPDEKDTTSTCIGEPAKTPTCAVETMMACWLRGDASLCRIATIGEWPAPRAERYFPFTTSRFVGSARVGPKGWWRYVERRFGGHYRNILPEAEPGDLAVFVHAMPCRTRTDCIEMYRKTPPDLYAVRRVGGIWKVSDWTHPVF